MQSQSGRGAQTFLVDRPLGGFSAICSDVQGFLDDAAFPIACRRGRWGKRGGVVSSDASAPSVEPTRIEVSRKMQKAVGRLTQANVSCGRFRLKIVNDDAPAPRPIWAMASSD